MKRWNRWTSVTSRPPATVTRDRLRALFRSWAYAETHHNVFATSETRPSSPRSDFTSLVARDAATVERDVPRPLRRSYAGPVFRPSSEPESGYAEVLQAGAELIGMPTPNGDVEMLRLALEGLSSVDLQSAQIHVGHAGFVRALLERTNLSPIDAERICNLMACHDREGLTTSLREAGVANDDRTALIELLELAGDQRIIEDARRLTHEPRAREALDELEAVTELLNDARIIVDLSEVRDLSYYTGIRFEGFSSGVGRAILRGGRYDELLGAYGTPEPAVGCAFEIGALAEALGPSSPSGPAGILLRFPPDRWDEAARQAERLRAAGRSVAMDPMQIDDVEAYMQSYELTDLIDLSTCAAQDRRTPCNR